MWSVPPSRDLVLLVWRCRLHLPLTTVGLYVLLPTDHEHNRHMWFILKSPTSQHRVRHTLDLQVAWSRKLSISLDSDPQVHFWLFALFTIARTWKQPKCPSTDEWVKKMWHIYTMEYNSAIKRNEIELFVVRWMDLESVIQSEVREKQIQYANTYIWNLKKKWLWRT